MEITKLNLNIKEKTITISAAATKGGYIESIYIDTQNSFICSSEHSTLASKVDIDLETPGVEHDGNHALQITDYIIHIDELSTRVGPSINLENDMLFIFIYGAGEEIASVIFDQNTLYQKVFKGIHTSIIKDKCCNINQGAADLALLFEAFLLSWSTADPRKFIYYWNRIHNVGITSNTCKCNG